MEELLNHLKQYGVPEFEKYIGNTRKFDVTDVFGQYEQQPIKMRVDSVRDSQVFTITFIHLKHHEAHEIQDFETFKSKLKINRNLDGILNTVFDCTFLGVKSEKYFAFLQKFYAQPLSQVFGGNIDATLSVKNQLASQNHANEQYLPPGQQKSSVTIQAVMDYLIGAILITDQIVTKGLTLRPQDLELCNFLVVKSAYNNVSAVGKTVLEASRILMNFEQLEPYMAQDLHQNEQTPSDQLLKKLAKLFLPFFHKALHNLSVMEEYEKINFKPTLGFMMMSNAKIYSPLVKMLVNSRDTHLKLDVLVNELKSGQELSELREKHQETFKQYQDLASGIYLEATPVHAGGNSAQKQSSQQRQLDYPSPGNKARTGSIIETVMGMKKQAAEIANGLDSDDLHYGLAQLQINFLNCYIRFCRTTLSDLRFLRTTYTFLGEEGLNLLLHYNWPLQASLEGLIARVHTQLEQIVRSVMRQDGLVLYEMYLKFRKVDQDSITLIKSFVNKWNKEWSSEFKNSRANLGELMKISERLASNPNSSSIPEMLEHIKTLLYTYYLLVRQVTEQRPSEPPRWDHRQPAKGGVEFAKPDLKHSHSGTDARTSYERMLWKSAFQLHFVVSLWGYYPQELGPAIEFDVLKSYIRQKENLDQIKQELAAAMPATSSTFQA